MTRKVRLDITPAVADYATEHGARYDKVNGWYCFEPVPVELEEFVDKTEKIKKQYTEKHLQCPKCGGQMELKPTRDGRVFWGCMSFPDCKGSLSVEKAESTNFKKVLNVPQDDTNSLVNKTHLNFKELAESGLKELGSQKEFEVWLRKPKVALNGKRPIEVIGSDEGYNLVMDLLRKINL